MAKRNQKVKTETMQDADIAALDESCDVLSTATLDLPCALTDSEILTRKTDFIITLDKIDELEAQRKRESDALKEEIAKLDEEALALRRQLRSGVERRDVACTERRDMTRRLAVLTRDDDGSEVSTRELMIHELREGDAE